LITEKGKDKTSSNGTFIFMKSLKQMKDHIPSDLIPLYEGMIISFINYEIKVKFEKKSAEEVQQQTVGATEFFQKRSQEIQAKASSNGAAAKQAAVAAEAEVVAQKAKEDADKLAQEEAENLKKQQALEAESKAAAEKAAAEEAER